MHILHLFTIFGTIFHGQSVSWPEGRIAGRSASRRLLKDYINIRYTPGNSATTNNTKANPIKNGISPLAIAPMLNPEKLTAENMLTATGGVIEPITPAIDTIAQDLFPVCLPFVFGPFLFVGENGRDQGNRNYDHQPHYKTGFEHLNNGNISYSAIDNFDISSANCFVTGSHNC